MDELLRGLNHAQRLAVTSPSSVLQVLAPPGSGKTKTLTARVSYLITQRGLKPWNIIVCTFTVKAAREMKERIRVLVGGGLENKLILGTFHSVARRFLVSYGHLVGIEKNFGIADASDSRAMITRIIKRQGLTIEPGAAGARISSLKAKSISAEQYAVSSKAAEQEFSTVYSEYEEGLRTSNLLDYDDLLLRCALLLRKNPQCISNIEAVLIDEFQDTNNVQFELMCLFAQYKKNVTIVGDPDQSIYGWRNAEIKNLQRMEKRFPGTDVIHLEENYRSAGAILHSAQRVIEQDESRPAKALKPTFGVGDRPVLRRLPTADAEAKWLVSEIGRTQSLSASLLKYNDFAVLLRSAAVSRNIESALGNAGIPYRMVGGTKFFDRFEVKMILDYLRILNQPDHNDALLRVINVPTRGVGDTTVKGLIDEAEKKGITLWKIILNCVQGVTKPTTKLSAPAEKGLKEFVNIILTGRKKLAGDEGGQASPFDLVEYLIKKVELVKFLQKKYPDDFDARWANVEELKAQTADLTVAMAHGKDFIEEEILPEIEGLEQRAMSAVEDTLTLFLANIALSSEIQKKGDGNSDQETEQHVTISTIHAAKGLEWPVVFIPACYEGCIPHSRAEDTDEERRLLYVGMTRAQALLYLSCPTKNSQTQETTMSHFLTQGGLDSYFEARGPMLYDDAIVGLAKILRREKPSLEQIIEARSHLEDPEDDYWPLDGVFPNSESSRWDHGRDTSNRFASKRRKVNDRSRSPTRPATGFMPASMVTMQKSDSYSISATSMPSKITTAFARMQELEAVQEEARLRSIDERKKAAIKEPGKRSKAAIGSGNIMDFFGKPKQVGAVTSVPGLSRTTSGPEAKKPAAAPRVPSRHASNPLTDISNVSLPTTANAADAGRNITSADSLTIRKPRTTPLNRVPSTNGTGETAPDKRKNYTFLSSPPPADPLSPPPAATQPHGEQEKEPLQPAYRPATTFHTTSVSQVGNKTNSGRRLGMGRSFKPWSARGGRGAS